MTPSGTGLSTVGRYTLVGCYKDNVIRAISGVMTTYTPTTAIEKCSKRAKKENNQFFAIQAGTQCFTSSNAGKTYAKYGKSTGCSNGRGGTWAMDVYKAKLQVSKPITKPAGMFLIHLNPIWGFRPPL